MTLTRQLTHLGMEIQQSYVTIGAAPRPAMEPFFFKKLYSYYDGKIPSLWWIMEYCRHIDGL